MVDTYDGEISFDVLDFLYVFANTGAWLRDVILLICLTLGGDGWNGGSFTISEH